MSWVHRRIIFLHEKRDKRVVIEVQPNTFIDAHLGRITSREKSFDDIKVALNGRNFVMYLLRFLPQVILIILKTKNAIAKKNLNQQ